LPHVQNTSLKDITNTINVTGVTRVKLAEDDIRMVLNTLIADCRWDAGGYPAGSVGFARSIC
jgi:hypothetical protein